MSDPLSSRIASGLQTVKAWDEDPALLKTVRDSIPFEKLLPEWYENRNDNGDNGVGPTYPPDGALRDMFPRRILQLSSKNSTAHRISQHASPYAREDDVSYEGDDLFLKRLTLYFKLDVMTWVNNPCCDSCGDTKTTNCGMRGPMTAEEVQGQAGRVERKFLIRFDFAEKAFCKRCASEEIPSSLTHGLLTSVTCCLPFCYSVQLPDMRWSPDDHISTLQLCSQAFRDQKGKVRRMGKFVRFILSRCWL